MIHITTLIVYFLNDISILFYSKYSKIKKESIESDPSFYFILCTLYIFYTEYLKVLP